jgi:hypothetical protein
MLPPLHKLANLVTHAMRCLVSHAKLAFQFLSGHAVFGTTHQEHGKEPFFQGRFRLVENSASGRINLRSAPSASVGTTFFDRVKAIRLAAFAFAAIGIARLEDEVHAGTIIGELFVEFVNRIFRAHLPKLCQMLYLSSRDNYPIL